MARFLDSWAITAQGKTTTINMLTTLILPTEGSASIAGFDVVRDNLEVRKLLDTCQKT